MRKFNYAKRKGHTHKKISFLFSSSPSSLYTHITTPSRDKKSIRLTQKHTTSKRNKKEASSSSSSYAISPHIINLSHFIHKYSSSSKAILHFFPYRSLVNSLCLIFSNNKIKSQGKKHVTMRLCSLFTNL